MLGYRDASVSDGISYTTGKFCTGLGMSLFMQRWHEIILELITEKSKMIRVCIKQIFHLHEENLMLIEISGEKSFSKLKGWELVCTHSCMKELSITFVFFATFFVFWVTMRRAWAFDDPFFLFLQLHFPLSVVSSYSHGEICAQFVSVQYGNQC